MGFSLKKTVGCNEVNQWRVLSLVNIVGGWWYLNICFKFSVLCVVPCSGCRWGNCFLAANHADKSYCYLQWYDLCGSFKVLVGLLAWQPPWYYAVLDCSKFHLSCWVIVQTPDKAATDRFLWEILEVLHWVGLQLCSQCCIFYSFFCSSIYIESDATRLNFSRKWKVIEYCLLHLQKIIGDTEQWASWCYSLILMEHFEWIAFLHLNDPFFFPAADFEFLRVKEGLQVELLKQRCDNYLYWFIVFFLALYVAFKINNVNFLKERVLPVNVTDMTSGSFCEAGCRSWGWQFENARVKEGVL